MKKKDTKRKNVRKKRKRTVKQIHQYCKMKMKSKHYQLMKTDCNQPKKTMIYLRTPSNSYTHDINIVKITARPASMPLQYREKENYF